MSLTPNPYLEKVEKSICVFAAARPGAKVFQQDAQKLGKLIAEAGYGLVFGGIMSGLMADVAQEVLDARLPVTGVFPHPIIAGDRPEYLGPEHSYFGINLLGTQGLEARKHKMVSSSDAVIALAGGAGSFDEIATVVELGRQANKPSSLRRFVILNTAGFYDGLEMQFNRMQEEGFVPPDCLPTFVNSPAAAMNIATAPLPDPSSSLRNFFNLGN